MAPMVSASPPRLAANCTARSKSGVVLRMCTTHWNVCTTNPSGTTSGLFVQRRFVPGALDSCGECTLQGLPSQHTTCNSIVHPTGLVRERIPMRHLRLQYRHFFHPRRIGVSSATGRHLIKDPFPADNPFNSSCARSAAANQSP
jgi:hypothetical protein